MGKAGFITTAYGTDAVSAPDGGLVTWASADGLSFILKKDDGTLTKYYAPSADTHGAVVQHTMLTDATGGLTIDRLNVGTATGAAAGQIRSNNDIYPVSDARGIVSRFIYPITDTLTDHFRSGIIPTGYTWRGAPLNGTPVSLNYSYNGEYMYAMGSATQSFLATAITNSSGAWVGKSIWARLYAGDGYECGLRVDDGTDANYIEAYMLGLSNGTQQLKFRSMLANTPTVVASSIIVPQTQYVIFKLMIYSVTTGVCYPIGEDGQAINAGLATATMNWVPAAGRVGLFQTGTSTGGLASFDWFTSNFA